MRIDLPLQEGVAGEWRVKKFHVDEMGARMHNMRERLEGRKRYILPGDYWMLTQGSTCVMSNTPAEYADHYKFIQRATGDVLIGGLGLGMVVAALLRKPEVSSITVVEISQDVIDLVSPCYTDPRVIIVHGDLNTWVPDRHFDYAWYDIWSYISGDEYQNMLDITKRLRKYVSHSDCWCKHECKKLATPSDNFADRLLGDTSNLRKMFDK